MNEPIGPIATGGGGRGKLRGILKSLLRNNAAVLVSLIVRAAAVVAGFAVTLLIARNLGAAATGQFALLSQTAVMLSVIGLLGLDVSAVRHFAKARAHDVKIAVRSLFEILGASAALILAIILVLWLGGSWIWRLLFDDTVPEALLPVLCLLLIGRAGARMFGALLRSQHAFALGQIVPALIIPLFTSVALLTGLVDTVSGALWAMATGGLVAVALGAFTTFAHASRGEAALRMDLRATFASAIPLWGVGIAQNIADWYGLIVAAQILGAAEAGLFRAGIQIATVLQVASMALFSVYSAKISTAFHAEDRQEVANLASAAVRISSLIAIPVGGLLILFGKLLLAQFGPEFEEAYPLLVILVLGQIALALSGPCGLVLAMSGNERLNLTITLVSTVLLLILAPISAHFAGLIGLAACVSIAIVGRNLAAYQIVSRKEGILIWSGTVRNAPSCKRE